MWTANDDHPGPTGRRHSCTGGDADQSVAIRTPRTTPSRFGPRKPGHSPKDRDEEAGGMDDVGTVAAGADTRAVVSATATGGAAGAVAGLAGAGG